MKILMIIYLLALPAASKREEIAATKLMSTF